MDLIKAMNERHSVRRYLDKPIEGELVGKLQEVIDECNKEGGLHIQLILNEPKAFDCFMARYGNFENVTSYVALIGGKKDEEKIGYYGEKIALTAQALGLNTCWVAMSYKKIKTAFVLNKGEKMHLALALGYGATQGVAHKSKEINDVADVKNAPAWFVNGVRYALLAPTAMNQQKFSFEYVDGKVVAKAGVGFYTKADLGIAKRHFELGAEKDASIWKK